MDAMLDLDDGSNLDVLVVGGSDVHIDERLESFCDDDEDDDDICCCCLLASPARQEKKE